MCVLTVRNTMYVCCINVPTLQSDASQKSKKFALVVSGGSLVSVFIGCTTHNVVL